MAERKTTHILLDCFGTLADYSPSRTEQGYHRSHALARDMGARVGYRDFLDVWSAESQRLDQRCAADDSEYSMEQLAEAFLGRLLQRQPADAEVAAFVASYLQEWNAGVSYPAGTEELIARLAENFRLGVVSNTHKEDLVRGHLAAMGISRYLAAVVVSVRVGHRKPHPAIYAAALAAVGAEPEAAVFVGDDYEADYAGPLAVGIRSYLIDSTDRHDVPASRRLRSLRDLPGRLGI